MKKYVVACGEKLENEPYNALAEQYAKPDENYRVQLRETPDWTFEHLEEAESLCRDLLFRDMHFGPHHCPFTVETLAADSFAVVCATHPEDGER